MDEDTVMEGTEEEPVRTTSNLQDCVELLESKPHDEAAHAQIARLSDEIDNADLLRFALVCSIRTTPSPLVLSWSLVQNNCNKVGESIPSTWKGSHQGRSHFVNSHRLYNLFRSKLDSVRLLPCLRDSTSSQSLHTGAKVSGPSLRYDEVG